MKQFMYFNSTQSIRRLHAALAVCLATLGLGLSAAADAPKSFNTSTLQSAPQVQYIAIELEGRRVDEISQSGQIVGNKNSEAGRIHAVFWPSSQGAPIDLGTLPDFPSSSAQGMNRQREIVGIGYSDDFSTRVPLFWGSPNSAPVELPGLPDGLSGEAYDINPSGKIVGQFYNADFSVDQAVLWPSSNAAPVYLPQLSENLPLSGAAGINAPGNILGDSCAADLVECHVTFWATSTSTPVALASPGGDFIYTDFTLPGQAINGAGNMVGYARNADFSATRGVFWASSSSPPVILTTVGLFTNAIPASISENGQIVGSALNEDFSKEHPFLWPSATSQGIDLTTFFPPDSDWDLDSMFAVSVNNRGEIGGGGFFKDGTGTQHSFLLIPVRGH